MPALSEQFEQIRDQLAAQEAAKCVGISSKQIVARNYSDAELETQLRKLLAEPPDPLAAFFFDSFVNEKADERIPERIKKSAADIALLLLQQKHQRCSESAVTIFMAWGKHRNDYRDKCFALLHHGDDLIRMTALENCWRFLVPGDYEKLFSFHKDPYVSEISMSGPLRYFLRDHALKMLEWLTKAPQSAGDCFENTANGPVSYRSWSAFFGWWGRNKRNFK